LKPNSSQVGLRNSNSAEKDKNGKKSTKKIGKEKSQQEKSTKAVNENQ